MSRECMAEVGIRRILGMRLTALPLLNLMEETFLLFFVERLRIMDCVVLCFDHSGARFPKLRCRTSVVTCLRRTVFTSDCFRQVRVMLLEHSPKSQKCSSDLLPFPEDVAKA